MIGKIILLAILIALAVFIYKVTKNDDDNDGGQMQAV